jgi:hypothetical protein
MLMVKLPRILKNELGRYIIRAFKYTYKQENRQFKKSTGSVEIDLNYDASNLLRQLHDGILRTDSFYQQFTGELGSELDKILAETYIEDTNLDAMIDAILAGMERKINLSVGRATRIARTELIHVSNEARLRAFQERMEETGEEYKFTLVVAEGRRTCDAHKELERRIPKRGLPLQELIELQIEVGKKHFGPQWTLQGHAMMHPNQRTILTRQV